MARPLPLGVSVGFETFGLRPLSDAEQQSGTFAFACLLYQYGAASNAWIMIGLWGAGIATPRLLEYLGKRRDAKTATSQAVVPLTKPIVQVETAKA